MAAQIPPPPPGSTPEAAKKKGLHPVAWLAIGCLVFVIIAGVLVTAGGIFVAKKAKDALGDDPAMATAEMIIKIAPELELVESDRDSRTLTVREKQTGTIATFDVSAIQNGEFSFESDGKTVAIDGSGDGGSLVTITEEGGSGTDGASTTVMEIGSQGDTPSWVPVYPGTTPTTLLAMTQNGVTSGSYQLTTTDSFDDVLTFFESAARNLTDDIHRTVSDVDGDRSAVIQTKSSDGQASFTAIIQDDGRERTAVVTHQGSDG